MEPLPGRAMLAVKLETMKSLPIRSSTIDSASASPIRSTNNGSRSSRLNTLMLCSLGSRPGMWVAIPRSMFFLSRPEVQFESH